MACVNKNLPAFKTLAAELGDSLAESIVVANKYEIPTVEQAIQIIRGSNVLQYKKAVRYLLSTTSSDTDDLVNSLNRVIQRQGDVLYVIKGSPLEESAAPLAQVEVLNANVRFLQEINNQFGPIFDIQQSLATSPLQQNKTGATQAFFSDVVTGKSDKFKPKKAWSPIVSFTDNEAAFRNVYEKYKGNFDEHIATSIPTFRETQIKVGAALSALYNQGGVIYDIGGSEGGFVKAITESSEGRIKSINLDVNEDMQAAHNNRPVDNSLFVNEAFLESYTDEQTGKTYERHVPQEKADVVHESMVFQFISPEREQFISEIKNAYLKPDGIVLLEEKIVPASEEEWKANEERKDSYKLQYYPQEALDQKKEEVLVGMKKNQTAEADLLNALKNNFKFVAPYWNSGNFKGYAASNSKEKLDQFIATVGGEITSPYSSGSSITLTAGDVVVAGKRVIVNPPAAQFRDAIQSAINKRQLDGSQVEVKSVEDYQKIIDDGGYLFLAEDGSFGRFVTNDGYMGSLFKDPDFKERIRQPITELVVSYGAKYADSYSMLEKANNETGFKSVARLPFDEAVAPAGWENTTLASKPDIVFYSYSPNTTNTPGEGEVVSSYTEGLELAKNYSNSPTNTNKAFDPSNVEVKVNTEALNTLAETNKASGRTEYFQKVQENSVEFERNIGFWSEDQKRAFSLANTTRMLQSKFGIQFDFINEPDGNYRAKYSQGRIVINEAQVRPDTPFHEIIHPFTLVMKNQNAELYNSLKEDLQSSEAGQAVLARVQQIYPELTPDEQIDEAIAEYVGQLAGERNLEQKPWYQKFMDWLRTTLANMGVFAKDFQPTMTLSQFADLILDPSFVFNLERETDLQNQGEYYQKSNQQVETDFNNVMTEVLRKLQADVNIPAKNEEERTRKYFSGQQLESLQQNRKDIEALDSFVLSALSQTKKITESFEAFQTIYENKNAKTPEDIKKMTDLLYQMENTLVLYSDLRPLVRSMKELFPEEADNWGSLVKYLERQDQLIEGYRKYGLDAVSEWLMPYMKKAINQAKASGKIHSIVSVETYTEVSNLLKSKGVTDENVILREAVKQEVQKVLRVAKDDTGFFSNWFSGVLNEKDPIAQLVGLALSDEMQKALRIASNVRTKILQALKQYRGNVTFSTAKAEEDFYKKYLRQANSYEYVGLDQNGNEKYEYVKRWAFHEEFLWDEFYNAKREFMEKLGERPSRESPQFAAWEAKRKAWFDANTKALTNNNGKISYVPAEKYRNTQFVAMMNDPYYQVLYNNYKQSNDQLGNMGLKYGMIPQLSKGKNLFSNVTKTKKFKEGLKKGLENLRQGIGAEEQIYYAENIEGMERKTVPINHIRLLEEDDLSFNLADSVSKFATSAQKYKAMKAVEPHVLTLKNFINGNAYLKVDKRQALKNSAKGFAKLKKGSKDVMPVEATRLNDMLNSFINDVVYGESDERQIVQLFNARFIVYDKTDTSNNGQPIKQVIKNFEDLRQLVGRPELNFSDFKQNEPLEFGNYVVTLSNKDWNLSLNKIGNFAGITTAVQTMAFNINSLVMNVGIGNVQSVVEAAGGRNFSLKDWAGAQREYWTAFFSGKFVEDVRGSKQSEISQLMAHYDAIQGEFEDTLGRKITPGLANKLFRRDNLFLVQRGGEHQIQATGMLAAMRGQKVKTTSGETITLRDAWVKDADNNLKLRTDLEWTEENDREFREKLSAINKELNGNYSKLDKAKAQRIWWTRALLMFRKHVYNAFKARYGKEQINYERGNVTEGYYRTFGKALVDQLSEYILNKKFRKLNDQERYAMRKLAADLSIIVVMLAVFKATDDDDDENEFNDEIAFWSRRMLSDTAQYAPVVGWLELWKMVKDPSASANTLGKYYEAISQFIVDPSERYERSGPGYTKGELKWKAKMAKIIPIYRQWVNIQNPEGLLDYYKLNVKSIFNPKKQTEEEQQELQQELEQEFGDQ
jgi:hypothetical protein